MKLESLGRVGQVLNSVDTTATRIAIQNAISDPSADPMLAMLVMSIVVVLVLCLVVVIMVLTTPKKRRIVRIRHYDAPPAGATAASSAGAPTAGDLSAATEVPLPPAPGRLFMALTGPVTLSLLALAGVIAAYTLTSTDSYCALTCHAGTKAPTTAKKADHAPCVSCHENGPLAFASNISSRTRMIVRYLDQGDSGLVAAKATVDSRQCLSCHHSIARRTTISNTGLKMSHVEVIAAGSPCTSCHAHAGHALRTKNAQTVSSCFPCHDSRQASTTCDTCHSRSTSAYAASRTRFPTGSGRWAYPVVRVSSYDCGGCHDQKRDCDKCHGIRMPHSKAFLDSGHAIAAAFDRKKLCWNCHDPQFCSNGDCHNAGFDPRTGDTTHGSGWKQAHQSAAWDAGCVCHQGRYSRTAPICTLCHNPDHSLKPVTP